ALKGGGQAASEVLDAGDRRDEERGRDDEGPSGVEELVVQRVLPGDEGRAVGDRDVPAGPRRPHDLSEGLRPLRAPGGEVVEERRAGGGPSDGDDGAQGLVDRRG